MIKAITQLETILQSWSTFKPLCMIRLTLKFKHLSLNVKCVRAEDTLGHPMTSIDAILSICLVLMMMFGGEFDKQSNII